jgi:hypothetical protein
MSNLKFWTPSEDNALRTCLSKFKNDWQASKWAGEKFGRTTEAVYQRVLLIRSGKEITYKEHSSDKVVVKKEQPKGGTIQKGVTIPKGFTFDIQPSRAVMFEDHVRLYF